MTITSTPSEVSYAGDGVTVAFPIPFVFDTSADLKVISTDDDGNISVLTTGFSVSGGSGSTGTLTFGTAPASTVDITILDNPEVKQATDYVSNDPFPAESHERALDRLTRICKRLVKQFARTLHTQDGDPISDLTLGSVDNRKGKYLFFNALTGAIEYAANIVTTTLSQSIIGQLLNPQTAAEAAASVTPSNYAYPALDVRRYGALGNGVADDRAAVQMAVDVANLAGGGVVVFEHGKTYRLVAGGTAIYGNTASVVVKAGAKLDLNGATLSCEVGTGNQCAVWLYGDRAAVKNGTINAVSSGSPSSQYFFHAAISIGIQNNSGDTPGSPSAGQFMRDWEVRDVELATTRQHCPVIQGMGGIHNGLISGVEIPDSAACSGIHFDWGNVGTVSSAAIATTRASFDGGTAYTTHPHNIKIQNVRAGTLSVAVAGDLGANLVRLSGCYGIEVDGVEAESVTLAGYLHTGGDLGFEFAQAIEKFHAYKNNVCRRLSLRNPSALYGAYIDTLGDNIYREQFLAAYVPLANPLWHGNVVIEDCDLVGAGVGGKYGVRVIQARGVKIRRCSVQRSDIGILIDEFTADIDVEDSESFGNRADGIKVGVQALRENTERVNVRRNRCYGNGTAGTGYGINIQRCRTAAIDDNLLGTIDESTQDIGLLIADSGVIWNVSARRNHVLGATVGAYNIGGSAGPYFHHQIGEFASNTAELSCPQTIIVSQAQVPHRSLMQANRWAKEYINNNAGSPTTGHWYQGSRLFQRSPSAANPAITEVTTSGSFGTLAGLTNGATNASNVITCSLAARTATTMANSYQITVSSATDLRVGLKCSVAAGGISDARIISIAGTTVELDTPAKSTQSGGAFTTAGLIEGEVVSLDTTPAIASAVVMAISGTTVTLDTAASSSESGRTLSYTAPAFKNHANIAA